MRFRRKVQHGQKLGRTIGFPTLNFNLGRFGEHFSYGIYACFAFIQGKKYKAALHFGPKFPQKKITLEMYVLNFDNQIYNQFVLFEVLEKIRDPMTFNSLQELKKCIQKDINLIKQL